MHCKSIRVVPCPKLCHYGFYDLWSPTVSESCPVAQQERRYARCRAFPVPRLMLQDLMRLALVQYPTQHRIPVPITPIKSVRRKVGRDYVEAFHSGELVFAHSLGVNHYCSVIVAGFSQSHSIHQHLCSCIAVGVYD